MTGNEAADSMVEPGPGEHAMTAWREVPFSDFVIEVLDAAGHVSDRPVILAIDGRGGGGKSTLAVRIADAVPRAAIVSTDDIAWGYSIFWELWQREEVPFFVADRPWERASLVVASSPVIPLAPGAVAVASPSGQAQ